METLEQALTQAAQVLNFEQKDELVMLDITISSNTDSDNFYTIRLPKLFIEEFTKVVIDNQKTLKI